MLTQAANDNACLSCGACCAYFRVSFYWAEGECIPPELIEQISPVYSCMKGTNQKQSKCIALQGEVGKSVRCGIYDVRSSSCKEVHIGDEQCNKSRKAYNFIPIIHVNDTDYGQVG